VSPSFERGMATPVDQNVGGRVILIGALHMCRTAEYLQDSVNLAYPGFRQEKDKINQIVKDLKKVNVGGVALHMLPPGSAATGCQTTEKAKT
jgi:hypothetical protein